MKKTRRAWKRYGRGQLVLWPLLAGLLLSPSGCFWQGQPKAAVVRRRLLEGARVSMVRVRIYFKRDIDNEFGSGEQEVSFQERLARRMVDRKMSLDLGGVVLDDQGHILIADPETEERLIDRIEVIGPNGQVRRGRLVTILKKMDAAVLKVSM